MSDLKTTLERVADAGVAGIALLPVHEARERRQARARNTVAVMAGMCIVAVALVVAVAVSVGSPREQRFGSDPKLVADASYEVPSNGMSPTLQIGDVVSGTTSFDTIERGDVVRPVPDIGGGTGGTT